ncbi:hypothetical protein JW756_04490 [Candidatus Woesearchaeota archaeon]|nr:hypothetical protein [Candidatus Woesearchaeota archaeon]
MAGLKPSNNYRLVKYCRQCHQRFLLNKGERITNYCAACQKKFQKFQKEDSK